MDPFALLPVIEAVYEHSMLLVCLCLLLLPPPGRRFSLVLVSSGRCSLQCWPRSFRPRLVRGEVGAMRSVFLREAGGALVVPSAVRPPLGHLHVGRELCPRVDPPEGDAHPGQLPGPGAHRSEKADLR